MAKLLSILSALVDWLERTRKTREAKRHEQDVRDLQDSPSDWLDGHFNGLHGDVSDDASGASKAGAPEHGGDGNRGD